MVKPNSEVPLLYVVGIKDLGNPPLSNLPDSMREFLRGPDVKYVGQPDDIPFDESHRSVPLLMVSSGRLDSYVARFIDEHRHDIAKRKI